MSTEELALLLRERMIGGETDVSPIEGARWAPLAHWLPELVPFATHAPIPLPPPARSPAPPPPALPAPAPWDPPALFEPRPPEPRPPEPRPFEEPLPFALPHAPAPATAKGAWTDRKPHPWRRYWARILDVPISGGLMGMLIGMGLAIVAPAQAERLGDLFKGPFGSIIDLLLTLVLAIPGNALLIGLTGSTVGKWVFGVRIQRPDGRPIGVMAALWRELRVWFQGLAMGIPFVSLFTLFAGFSWLKDDGHAPWDPPRRRIVTHRPGGALQVLLTILGLALIIAARVGIKLLEQAS